MVLSSHYLELVVNKDPYRDLCSEVQDQIEMTRDKVQANSEFAEPKINLDQEIKFNLKLKMQSRDLLESAGWEQKDQEKSKDIGLKRPRWV